MDWQANIPIRTLESAVRQQPSAFYVRVGNEDSLGSSLPPDSLALMLPTEEAERMRPNPRAIYLLQFGNGYALRLGREMTAAGPSPRVVSSESKL